MQSNVVHALTWSTGNMQIATRLPHPDHPIPLSPMLPLRINWSDHCCSIFNDTARVLLHNCSAVGRHSWSDCTVDCSQSYWLSSVVTGGWARWGRHLLPQAKTSPAFFYIVIFIRVWNASDLLLVACILVQATMPATPRLFEWNVISTGIKTQICSPWGHGQNANVIDYAYTYSVRNYSLISIIVV